MIIIKMNNNNKKNNNKVLKSKKPFFTTNKIAIIIVLVFVIVIGTALGILYGTDILDLDSDSDSDSCDKKKIMDEIKKNNQQYNYIYGLFEEDFKKSGCEQLINGKQKLDELSDEQKVFMNDFYFFYFYKNFTTKKEKLIGKHFKENQDIFKKWFTPTTSDNVKIYIQEFEDIKRMLTK